MKRILLLVGAILVVVGVAVLVVQHSKQFQNNKTHDDQVAAQKAANEKAAEQAEDAHATRLQSAYDHERVECGKGSAAYAKLTPTLQKTTPAPICGPAVVQ